MSALTKMKFLATVMYVKDKFKMNQIFLLNSSIKTSSSEAWYDKIQIDSEICVLFWKVIFLLNKLVTLPQHVL